MGYDSFTTTLYATDLINLYSLNQATGAATVVAPLTGGLDGAGLCSTTPVTSPFPLPRIEPIDDLKVTSAGTIYGILNCGSGFVGTPLTFLITLTTGGAIGVIGQTVDVTGAPITIDGIAFQPGPSVPGVPQFPLGVAFLFALLVPALLALRKKTLSFRSLGS